MGIVAVHHDPTGAALGGELSGCVQMVPEPRPIRWGDYSHIEASLAAFDWLLREVEFDWLVVLSGQDYPVRPLGELERHLADTGFDGFIEGSEVPAPSPAARVLGRGLDAFDSRYYFRYVTLRPPGYVIRLLRAAWPAQLVRAVPSGEVRVGLPRASVAFTDRVRCRRGAEWYTLSRRCVEVLVSAPEAHPKLTRQYRHTLLPVESFAHTILYGTPGLRLSGDYMRFTSWQPNAPHPDVLTIGDLDRIAASGAFFARKFDERTDAAVLDALDERLAAGA